jgi:hypothetical protein
VTRRPVPRRRQTSPSKSLIATTARIIPVGRIVTRARPFPRSPAGGSREGRAAFGSDLVGEPQELHYESNVEIPKGYSAAPPANLDLIEDFAEYHRSYAINGRVLATDRRLQVKLHEVPMQEFEAYRKFLKAASADQEKTLPLSSDAAPFYYQTEIWDLPGSDNPDAARAMMTPAIRFPSKMCRAPWRPSNMR